MSIEETIFALATAPGKSGVAIVRLSGPQALAALKSLSGLASPAPRSAYVVTLRSPADEMIDRGLALYFKAPQSFTGEDVVEFHLHGSLAVIRELLEILRHMEGLRPAEPGEFSRRAFINNKMDLMAAEAVADLVAAETGEQKKQALRQMQGELSGYYDSLRKKIVRALAHFEAYIDFPDENIPEAVLMALTVDIDELQAMIRPALADKKRGERLRDGISVVILGAPNVGKSSLLNTIAGRDAAIVSTRAGTTRDVIEIHMDIAGYPVVLVDTAGLRDSHDDIEAEGIRRALARATAADIKIVLFDGEQWPALDKKSQALLDNESLTVVNKCDLLSRRSRESGNPVLFISTKTGEGIESLLGLLEKKIVSHFSGDSAPLITRNRHRALLSAALQHLEKASKDMALELKCEELRLAAQCVGKITGKIQVDDVLDVIFQSFCIGK